MSIARFVLSLLLGASASATADATLPTVRQVSFTVEHQPDGGRYPNYVKESYSVDGSGRLRYSAYFGGMPIEMNHMDSVDWKAGARGLRVLDVARRLLSARAPGAVEQQGDMAIPHNGVGLYLVGLSGTTYFIEDRRSPAWSVLDGAFQALVAAFEKENHRPRKATDLPQSRASPSPLEAATAAANAALERAYAKSAERPGAVSPPHQGPWVTGAQAVVTVDARGHTYTWALHRPSGFELDAVVTVDARGAIHVVRAEAMFAPD